MKTLVHARALVAAAMIVHAASAAAQAPVSAPDAAPAVVDGPVAAASVPEAPAAAVCCTVAARTPIQIMFDQAVGTRAAKTGDRFAFHLVEPLIIDGQIVARTGTPGVGEVVHAKGPGLGGRAGELILAVRYLELGDRRVPLRSLRYGPRTGHDQTESIAMAAAFVGPAVFLISGGHVNVPQGSIGNAMVAQETILPPLEAVPEAAAAPSAAAPAAPAPPATLQ